MRFVPALMIGVAACALAAGGARAQTPTTAPVIGPPGGSASTQKPRTLNEALALTYLTNPALQAARAQLRSVDENVPQALAGWRPTVVLSGSGGYASTRASALSQFGLGNVHSDTSRALAQGQATITQPIYRGGRTRSTTNRAENQVYAQRARLITQEESTFTDVVNAFVSVIGNEQVLALNINNVQVLNRQLQATNDRFRVGEITRTDVAQAEAALAGAQAQRDTSEGNVQVARGNYRKTVGDLPDRLLEPQPLGLPVKNQVQANALAATNNPAVIAAAFDNAAAKDAVDVAFSALMPTLSVQGTTFRQDNQNGPATRSYGSEVLASLSVPLYQGGSEYSAVRQAKQSQQQTSKTLDDARRIAIQQATQAWENLVAARATADSTRAQIRANQIALVGVEQEALVGSRTTLDVLNAQQAVLNSQVTLVQNLANVVVYSYAVASAIGRLTARDLKLDVPLYVPEAYYNAVRNSWFGVDDRATDQPGR